MYTFMSINGSSGSCHTRRDAELIPICNRLLTDLHVVRKMKPVLRFNQTCHTCLSKGLVHRSLIFSKIVLKKKIAIKCYETIRYMSMN